MIHIRLRYGHVHSNQTAKNAMIDREVLINLAFLLSRYLHIVASALLVGGTLFYELIVPVAIDDLKDEQKLAVFARARWAFRWIVWCSSLVLLVTAVASSYRNWYAYNGEEARLTEPWSNDGAATPHRFHVQGVGHWWLAHAAGGALGLTIALSLVRGASPPRYPLVWMRINLLILLVVIFLASTTHHVRMRLLESQLPASPAAMN